MDFQRFLSDVMSGGDYAGQIVHVHEAPPRPAEYRETSSPLSEPVRRLLEDRGVRRLYSHQAAAIDLLRAGEDVVIATGTASGKSMAYVIALIETLLADPSATALLLFPTKALTQDQFRGFSDAMSCAGPGSVVTGVYDGDTPAPERRRLRDQGGVIFTNPDMLHAGLLAQHARWASFLQRLRWLVIDELHVYNGIFGSNVANLMRRFRRVCEHYGASPQVITCSATIANPKELAEGLIGRAFRLVQEDGSPRGRRTYVLWNPPRVRQGKWRSRRSANVEAHEIMARLIEAGAPTITFSKAKMTAEMIHRYVGEKLSREAPGLAGRITAYRGGYLPEDRREIERRLFSGELMGVSTTAALELGIDVGALDACVIVGYPGTLASFFQQSGRAGRREQDALVVLVGLDTAVNQYVMSHPEYLFERAVEQAVTDPDNPFVITGHLRCAAQELPIGDGQTAVFGPHAPMVLRVLQDNQKVRHIQGRWYHAASEVPHYEVSLREHADKNVLIEDVETGKTLGEVNKFDAQPLLHPEAIYMHQGDTYRVLELDLQRNLARVQKVEVDYYTQPLGGTDVHHIDHRLREKPFGTGTVCWGEVTSYFNNGAYEKVHFYSLDTVSQHALDLPTWVLETMALWIIPPDDLMARLIRSGLNAHSGLRGIGYATRMLLPMYMTCQTLDFSHTIGSANSPWNTVFIYERYPLGLGFTQKAYEILHRVMPGVLDHLRRCDCEDGCPVCTGKPLRGYTTWNVERGEGAIPSKSAAIMVLEGLLDDGEKLNCPDTYSLSQADAAQEMGLEQAVRRRLERMREPEVFHPIVPQAQLETQFPAAERAEVLKEADVAIRGDRRRDFGRELRKRMAKKLPIEGLDPLAPHTPAPPEMRVRGGGAAPTDFPGRPVPPREAHSQDGQESAAAPQVRPLTAGDALAARARKLKRKRDDGEGQ